MGAALAMGLAAAVLIARSITGPMRRALAVAESAAEGDLSSRIEVQGRSEGDFACSGPTGGDERGDRQQRKAIHGSA